MPNVNTTNVCSRVLTKLVRVIQELSKETTVTFPASIVSTDVQTGFEEKRTIVLHRSLKYIYLIRSLLSSIAEYFYELCRFFTSPYCQSKYKQRVKILSDTTEQNV